MSSFKSSENIQKKEGGPDRSVSLFYKSYIKYAYIYPTKAEFILGMNHNNNNIKFSYVNDLGPRSKNDLTFINSITNIHCTDFNSF